MAKKDFQRLPKSIIPKHYKVDLHPNLDNFQLPGTAVINLEINEENIKEIKLNSVEIKINSAKLNENVASSEIVYDTDNEQAIIKFADNLPVGASKLFLDFSAEINDKLKGFYRSKYIDTEGNEKFCAVTQFESTDARRCFPCWDEPACKATFEFSMTIDENLLGLSNMPVVEETKVENGLKKLQFESTPIMSTYLAAFYVGVADYVESETKYGVKVRVYTPVGKKEHGQFALDMGVKSLEFYEDYFNVKFPLPKCDQIGLDDFSAGAMENWGLVTYRSNCLLIDPANSSTAVKERVAIVVAHELAHQWFGNLVTMEWWTHLWLNEGFASFMEYLACDAIHPDYNVFDTFVKNDFSMGMELDALDSSHPIEVPVNHPSEVDEIFDHISYCKGSSTIRMLHSWIGDDNFRKGMTDYLNTHAYKNALTEQLWEKLEKSSNMPVAEVLSTWTSKTGFPLVEAEFINKTTLKLSQKRFSANGPEHMASDTSLWKIPIQICNSDSPQKCVQTVLLEDASLTVTIPETSWTKINCGAVGFYRVKYNKTDLANINVDTLMVRDRLQLQSDTFALCKAGYAPITDYFELLNSYKNEGDYSVMTNILSNLGDISLLARNLPESVQNNMKTWKCQLLSNLKTKLGWEKKDSDTHSDKLLRSTVMDVLGKSGDSEVVSQAQKMFSDHINGKTQIAGDLRSAIFSTIAANAESTEEIQKLIDYWSNNAESQEQQSLIERSIGYVKNEEGINFILDFINNKIAACNLPFAYVGLCYGSSKGADATWNYIQKNMDDIKKNCHGFLLQAMFGRTLCVYGNQEKYDQIKKFFEEQKLESAGRAINQMLEKIQIRANMLSRDGDAVSAYFA